MGLLKTAAQFGNMRKRCVLSNYADVYDESRLFDMCWYLRDDRRANADETINAACSEIERKYPEVLTFFEGCDNGEADYIWGELCGKFALVRYILDPDTDNANEVFPNLDT